MRLATLALLAAAGAARAEAPEAALRPEPRPSAVAPAQPDATPEAVVLAPRLDAAAPAPSAPEPATDALPVVPRRPPVLAAGPAPAPLEGAAGAVRAERAAPEVVSLEAVLGGWEGPRPRPRVAPPALAAAPDGLRPRPRPGDAAPVTPPADPAMAEAYAPPDLAGGHSAAAVAVALRPAARPPVALAGVVQVSARAGSGRLCGLAGLDGEAVAPVLGRGGCGIDQPVRVRSLDGVRLSEGSLMDCETAGALLRWIREEAGPAVGGRGGGIAALQVAGHYACRPRNNQSGARLSEHGKGHAIDIAAVVLADGSALSVARDWPDAALVAMHEGACGIFSTTLGPGSDGFHEDHLHFDTARGRGPYCR